MVNNDSKNYNIMPALLDREIESPDKDAFGHKDFAEALKNLIELPEPPYSIGLLGKWGVGKSSIKKLYLKNLETNKEKIKGLTRSERIFPITFNAWRYGGENIKKSLLRHVYKELEGDENSLKDKLYKQITTSIPKLRELEETLKDLKSVGLYLFASLSLLIIANIITSQLNKPPVLVQLFLALLIIVITLIIGSIIKNLLQTNLFFSNLTKIEFPLTSNEQFEDELIKQIEIFKEKHKKCERILIFIDDLDRLSAEEMISGLDAIRTFLEIPEHRLPKSIGIIFVISCDEERIADALTRRKYNGSLPGAIFTRNDARRFLDRIFQFRLEIPPFPNQDLRKYAYEKISSIISDFDSELLNNNKLEKVIERLIHPGVQNPRNALQLLNAFIQSWWIGNKREKAGLLMAGTITKNPISLAAICTLKVDFPDFYDDLLKEHKLLQYVLALFFENNVNLNISDSAKPYILKYAEIQNNNEVFNWKNIKKLKFKDDYRSLRTYLASLRRIDWPVSVQSLLMLIQDSLTLNIGDDSASELYKNLISGDYEGLEEVLGVTEGAKGLPESSIKLILNSREQITVNESEENQDNADFAIASIINKIDNGKAQELIDDLARRLTFNKELRAFVGLDSLKDILLSENISKKEQKELVTSLIKNLVENDLSFKLSEESDPQDHIYNWYKEISEIALKIKYHHEVELNNEVNQNLLSWIRKGEVKVYMGSIEDESGNDVEQYETQNIPFQQIHKWVKSYGEKFMLDLGGYYSSQLIKNIKNEAFINPIKKRI